VEAPPWLIDLVKVDESFPTSGGEPGDVNVGEVAAALAVIPNDNLGWEQWNRIGMALYRATNGSDDGFEIFDRWSAKATKYDQANTRQQWFKKYKSSPPNHIGVGTLFYLANEAEPEWRVQYEAELFDRLYRQNDAAAPPQRDTPEENEIPAPAFSEQALAMLFADAHHAELRYVAVWSKWLIYDGVKWRFDDTRKAWTYAGKVCRRAAQQTNKRSEKKGLASAKTRAAVINIAGDDRQIAATIDQWDTDQWLLNTPGGVVDLRTGRMRSHRPDDYMTKSTAVAQDARCPIPRWKAFLQKITDHNRELENYIRRALGYSLTGSTREQVLFFLYGQGKNGKGTLMTTASRIFADYHRTASLETFVVTTHERHSTDIAGLRGARLVTVGETEEGKRWAESKIKELTGGDKVTARFMRQDNFDFYPEFKLFISGNHRPKLGSVTIAIRRRMNMLPFTVIIPEEQRDRDLGEKLKPEWPGILAWMIDGCLEWQRIGLKPPPIVTDATDSYLETEDRFGRWIAECFHRDANGWIGSTDLFKLWQQWAAANGEFVGSQTFLNRQMEDHGFSIKRNKAGDCNGYYGLRYNGWKPDEQF
jgi:putative DNA primase/helicase